MVAAVLKKCKKWKPRPDERQLRELELQTFKLLLAFAVLAEGRESRDRVNALRDALDVQNAELARVLFETTAKERTLTGYINIIDALFESHVLYWKKIPIPWSPPFSKVPSTSAYGNGLIELNTTESRRVALICKAGLWVAWETENGPAFSDAIRKGSKVAVAQLLSPPIDRHTASSLNLVSLVFFEKKSMCWEGLQYSVLVDDVLKRLSRRKTLECPQEESIDAVSVVLKYVFSSSKDRARRMRERPALRALLPEYVRKGRLRCSLHETLLVIGPSVLTNFVSGDCMFELMLETLRQPGFDCAFCLQSAACHWLLFLDGLRLQQCRAIPGVDTNVLLAQSVNLFLSREQKDELHSQVRAHLREAQSTFSEKDWLVLEPLHSA